MWCHPSCDKCHWTIWTFLCFSRFFLLIFDLWFLHLSSLVRLTCNFIFSYFLRQVLVSSFCWLHKSHFFLFPKGVSIRLPLFLLCLVKVTSEAALRNIGGKVFNYRFNFLNHYRTSHVHYFFLCQFWQVVLIF